MRNMDRIDSSGVGRSKGFGFAEFMCHDDALDVLRMTNNNPAIFGPDRRPIVEFAIENSLILKRLEERKAKNFKKVKPRGSNDETSTEKNKRKRERGEKRKRKRVKKDENANIDDVNLATTTKTIRSDANTRNKFVKNTKVCKVVGSKDKQARRKAKGKESESKNKRITSGGDSESSKKSRSQQKRKSEDKDEEKFNQIVEKYKTKLFGDNTKRLKASRWFEA